MGAEKLRVNQLSERLLECLEVSILREMVIDTVPNSFPREQPSEDGLTQVGKCLVIRVDLLLFW